MRDDQHQFLRLLGQLPARLTAEQAAWLLNCGPHDIPPLIAARLLKPLGNPPANSVKFFAALELLEQVKDRTWLAKVTNALNQHWQKKNGARQNHPATGLTKGGLPLPTWPWPKAVGMLQAPEPVRVSGLTLYDFNQVKPLPANEQVRKMIQILKPDRRNLAEDRRNNRLSIIC